MYKITSIRGKKVIERQAIAVLEGNFKFQMSVFAPPEEFDRGRAFEVEFIQKFNKSQPHMKNKLVDISIL